MSVTPAPPQNNNNQPPSKKWLSVWILLAGTLLYVLGVIWIGVGSFQHVRAINAAAAAAPATPEGAEGQEQAADEPEPYPISDFMEKALLVIGGALATHLGAYLGISVTQGIFRTSTSWKDYLQSPDGVSGILAFTYVAALFLSIILWGSTGFSVYAGQPLQDQAYAFLGIFAGAMAALAKG